MDKVPSSGASGCRSTLTLDVTTRRHGGARRGCDDRRSRRDHHRGDNHGADRIRVRIAKFLKVFTIISARGRVSAPQMRRSTGSLDEDLKEPIVKTEGAKNDHAVAIWCAVDSWILGLPNAHRDQRRGWVGRR